MSRSAPAVAAQLAWAAQQLGVEHTRSGLLNRIVGVAPRVVPGTQHASITMAGPAGSAELVTPAASGPFPRQIDALQYQAGQGPCIDATREGRAVVVRHLPTETRWPRLVALIRQVPRRQRVRSVLALPMRTASGFTGSLNLFATTTRPATGVGRAAGAAMGALAEAAVAAVEQQERAASRNAQTESFITALAHDLRSGLTVALAAQDLLTDRRALLDAHGQEALDLLTDELNRQRQLLTDLLNLARAQTGVDTPPATALPLVVAETVRQWQRRGRPAPPVLIQPAAATALVAIHPVQLARIISNLLDNADRHAGGATAVQVGRSDDSAWVAVEDAGPGVPHNQRESIFLRFATTPRTAQPGAHAGLALSRQHARWAGGDLTITNRDSGGARFTLHLPTTTTHDVAPTARLAGGSSQH